MNFRLSLIGATAAIAIAAACGGPATTSAPTTAPTTAPTGAPSAAASAASSPTIASSAAPALSVTLADFKIEPSATTVAGGDISIAVMSNGPTPHNLTIRDANDEIVDGTEDLRAGDGTSLPVTLAPGEYTIFCALAGHESLGMHETLTVTAP